MSYTKLKKKSHRYPSNHECKTDEICVRKRRYIHRVTISRIVYGKTRQEIARHGTSIYVIANLQYRRRATLAQTFVVIKQQDKSLCVKEAEKLSSVMITTIIQPRVVTPNNSKGHQTSKLFKQVAMIVEVKVAKNPNMRCWKWEELSHSKENNVYSLDIFAT